MVRHMLFKLWLKMETFTTQLALEFKITSMLRQVIL